MSVSSDEFRESEHEKIRAEIANLIAEITKINAEIRWYPTAALAGIVAAVIALIIKLLIH